jgi:hypothetical protein
MSKADILRIKQYSRLQSYVFTSNRATRLVYQDPNATLLPTSDKDIPLRTQH